ncbi:uncharacterized protein LOC120712169 isoform X3 [Panicum virgatum]|uniref:uncharacterized protein LOC120712169 isoform X3 n=1 Tax=Panicum virgatum TaxID=38727 RepID=UPI0019D546DF|nr:uncharacterized protein LOC120712169 isoform X3 [Panicum virgatum]
MVEIKATMTEMRLAKDEFEAWKPEVDKSVADLQIAVNTLGHRFDKLFSNTVPASPHLDAPITHPAPEIVGSSPALATAHLVATSKEAAFGPHGHRVETHNWGSGFGVVYTIPHPSPVIDSNVCARPSSASISRQDDHASSGTMVTLACGTFYLGR